VSANPWTPGPWKTNRWDERDEFYGMPISVRLADKTPVAYVFVEENYGRDNPNAEADARLIAAAPEMAELLAQARDKLEDADTSLQMEFGTGPPTELPILKTIDGLLARIRGEA
jgi:hypothetical protein